MTREFEVRRASLLHPGPVLGRVWADDLYTAKLTAAAQYPGLLVSVAPVSREAKRIEKTLRAIGRRLLTPHDGVKRV